VRWFRRSHAECRVRHEVGRQQLAKLFRGCLRGSTPADQLARDARAIADAHFLVADECRSLAIARFQGAVEDALDDRLLSKEEEGKIDALMSEFALSNVDIGACAERLVKAKILREVDDGVVKPRQEGQRHNTVNLQKNEVVLWTFENVELHEIQSRTSYVGASHGVSFRIARGVYYRIGAFKGNRHRQLRESCTAIPG
jgi:hypothetical protein